MARLYDVAGPLAEFCQSLFPLLVAHADDFGRQQGDPFTVKHVCLPISPRSVSDFGLALQAMDDVGLIRWYEVDGESYIQIVKFDPHQPGLSKRTRSKHPEPSNQTQAVPNLHAEESRDTGISGTPVKFTEIPLELNRTELNRREGNCADGAGPVEPELPDEPLSSIPPKWGKGVQRRESELVATHPDCDPATFAACNRGICVPIKTAREWRQQRDPDRRDHAATDAYLRSIVAGGLATLPKTGPVGVSKFKFWDRVWADAHPGTEPSTKPALYDADAGRRTRERMDRLRAGESA